MMLLVAATRVGAADHVLQGAKITLSRSASGKEKLVFIVKDPAALFPVLGSEDDPAFGSPGGVLLELASTANPGGASFGAPSGLGNAGWESKDGARDSFKYRDPHAAPGPTSIRAVLLMQGRVIKVVGRSTGLLLAGSEGTVGVRLTARAARNCALFDAPTIRKDQAGRFIATDSVATALVDCSHVLPVPTTTTSSITTTTISGTTSTTVIFPLCSGGNAVPICGGACPDDDTCAPTVDAFTPPIGDSCRCYPLGVTPCGATASPTCGGACSNGGVCQAFEDTFSDDSFCACVNPAATCESLGGVGTCTVGRCPIGSVCLYSTAIGFSCGCGSP
ncbi:MAG TPA: hypothetical protein VGR62_12415 [Candidatus Binatia bacterium]|nr:hypothetical protein [Candidatus Binatia bacterium]